MKKTFLWLAKAFVSGLIAFAIVSVFCFFYYNLPVHHTNESGATDYLWDKNHLSFRGTEGFACTKTDENGFVNTFPDKKDTVDVLIMGSSHTEGFYVNGDENFTYVLNSKLKENGHDKYAYNIGTSSHNFIRCLKNLDNALNTYRPAEYIVIETLSTEFDTESLEQLDNGTFETLQSYNSGFIYTLQKSDFFRLVYAQISNFMKKDASESTGQKNTQIPSTEYKQLIEKALERASKSASQNNCKLIIVYNPDLEIDYNGNVTEQECSPKQEIFKAACEKYGIALIDMFPSYRDMYKETNHLPHGFSNTPVGSGHINKYGHACIAEELFDFITEE